MVEIIGESYMHKHAQTPRKDHIPHGFRAKSSAGMRNVVENFNPNINLEDTLLQLFIKLKININKNNNISNNIIK